VNNSATFPLHTSDTRYVLLIVNEEAHVRELLRLAEVLLRTADLRPVVFMEDRLRRLAEPKAFTERGIEVLTASNIASDDAFPLPSVTRIRVRRLIADFLANPEIARRIPARLRYRLGLLGPDDAELVRILRSVMLRRSAICKTVLGQRAWAAIVMCEDNAELDTAVWIEMARHHGVRSTIVPYTISNTAEFAESYVNFAPYQLRTSPQNRTVARLFPAWMLDYKGKQFLRSNFTKIVAVEQLGLAPPNPWLLNSGYADAIAVESDAMYDYYRAAGIPASQLVTTGSLVDDVLASALADAAARRRCLLSGFGRGDDRPFLLCGLPPDQNTFDRLGCEFKDFDDLLEFWGDCLAGLKDWNVVVRPHPKTPAERIDLLRRKGLAVSYDDTATLVPLCDLYVASVSATIRWAVACGKPVLNYDVYQYGYEDYRGLGGVLLVNSRDEFRCALADLTGEGGRLAAVADIQRSDSGRWAKLDGASAERIVALLREGKTIAAAAAARV
jgi:hypothetical protein